MYLCMYCVYVDTFFVFVYIVCMCILFHMCVFIFMSIVCLYLRFYFIFGRLWIYPPPTFGDFTPTPKSTHNNWKSAFRASIFELLHFFFVFGGFRRKLDIFGSGGRRENLIRVRGYPHFFDLWVRGTPTFFTEKSSFRRPYPINHSKTPKFVKFTKKWKKIQNWGAKRKFLVIMGRFGWGWG